MAGIEKIPLRIPPQWESTLPGFTAWFTAFVATGGADKTPYADVTIRRIADSVEVATASIVLNANTSSI